MMIRFLAVAMLVFASLPTTGRLFAMDAMSEADLADVAAQQGIALDLYLGINADSDGSGRPDMTVPEGLRRLGLRFEGRTDEWLTLKNYYGVIEVSNLFIDVAVSSSGPTAHAGDGSQFEDSNGNDLRDPLLGSPGGSVYNLPLVQFQLSDPLRLALTIESIGIEYGPQGYAQDNSLVNIVGVKVGQGSDGALNTFQPASIRMEGRIGVFGF
ncbi:hypothetical protein [Alcanivorax sp. 1008]|uniref:hypothetical protein n=1 Tax=Alcanivorax sp. 1008 TaxID=2816853 RepID=UPI001E10924C|nr:hypothetical protein [Alcanivorax sp. 1008]MCC1497084.1 hypothetical protein [Alcanivorax sp. 1008]